MNILHHKSWHVYSQKNQDKVREDEAKAEAAEKEKETKRIEQEREARLQLLRTKAQSRYQGTSVDASNKALAAQAMFQRAQHPSHESQTSDPKLAIERGSPSNQLNGFSTASILSSLKSSHQLVERMPARSLSPVASHPQAPLDFYQEFLQHLDSNLKEAKPSMPPREEKHSPKEKPPITNMFLSKGQESKPWYYQERVDHLSDSRKFSDQKVKSFHDPLESINKQLKQTAESNSKEDGAKKVILPKGVDKLRAERMEREARERERVKLLLNNSKFLHQAPRESQPYYNQYNSHSSYEAKHRNHSPLAKKHKSKKGKKDKKEAKRASSRSKP